VNKTIETQSGDKIYLIEVACLSKVPIDAIALVAKAGPIRLSRYDAMNLAHALMQWICHE